MEEHLIKFLMDLFKTQNIGILGAVLTAVVSLILGLNNTKNHATKDALSLLHATVDGLGAQVQTLKAELDLCHDERDLLRRQLTALSASHVPRTGLS